MVLKAVIPVWEVLMFACVTRKHNLYYSGKEDNNRNANKKFRVSLVFTYKLNGLENIVYVEALVNTSQDIRILTVIASPKKARDS